MGVFGLKTLVGWHKDSTPGPPACKSGVVAIRVQGPQLYLVPPPTYFSIKNSFWKNQIYFSKNSLLG